MFELEIRDGCRDARRLQQIIFGRFSAGDSAERASTRANVAEDHECCRAVLAPAFGDIGTHGVFANRIELMSPQDTADFEKIFTARNTDLQPIGAIAHIWMAAPNTASMASCVASVRVGCA